MFFTRAHKTKQAPKKKTSGKPNVHRRIYRLIAIKPDSIKQIWLRSLVYFPVFFAILIIPASIIETTITSYTMIVVVINAGVVYFVATRHFINPNLQVFVPIISIAVTVSISITVTAILALGVFGISSLV